MRDAFGGTFMLEILMVFIVLFVAFTAVIVNIASKFRIKNEIINIMEQYDYKNNAGGTVDKLKDYITKSGYNFADPTNKYSSSCSSSGGEWMEGGYCIVPYDGGSYYTVTVYVNASLPFFNLNFTFPITGESKTFDV